LSSGNVKTPTTIGTALVPIAGQLIQGNSRDGFQLQKEPSHLLISDPPLNLIGLGGRDRKFHSLDNPRGICGDNDRSNFKIPDGNLKALLQKEPLQILPSCLNTGTV